MDVLLPGILQLILVLIDLCPTHKLIELLFLFTASTKEFLILIVCSCGAAVRT